MGNISRSDSGDSLCCSAVSLFIFFVVFVVVNGHFSGAPKSLCVVTCMFLVAYFLNTPSIIVGPHWHSLAAQFLSSPTPSPPWQSGWVLIIPYRRSGHTKPTTVSSRSNQELVLMRLWRSALHSRRGAVCCIPSQIFTHCVQKSWPGCLAVWKRQASFYLNTASRNRGGCRDISHTDVCQSEGRESSLMPGKVLYNALFEQII